MVTLADSLVSSSARKLPVRVRADLTAKRQRYLGRSYWIVKDPIGLKYYRFQDEEYAILRMLDGTKSLDEIKDEFEAEFPPQKITLEELQQFLGMLHKSGLIVAGVPGQGYELKKRRDERRRQETIQAMSNILCIRFKGIDPERLLNWMYPKVKFLYHPVVVAMCVALALSALAMILVNFDHFRSNLPAFNDFFTVKNAFLLAVCLGVTKVIHEFGHGLTCKHFGGECHEMGVMILVLTPCLYCNVSDSWMLPSKYRRAMIGAAGIYVEVVLASICTFIWWYTQEGVIHYLALNVMFLSSVSTILFNANPLLRYDGYYILSDLVEIPNLRQKASQIMTRKLGEWCLGIEPPEDPFLPERNQALFALYSIAAVIYRWVVLFGILFFLYKVFEPVGLKVLGQAIAAMSLYGILVMPMWKLYKYLSVPGRLHQVKKIRAFATLAIIAGFIGLIFFVKLPYQVFAPVELRVANGIDVSVRAPGELYQIHVEAGDPVSAGDLIVQFRNPDLEQEVRYLEGEVAKYQQQVHHKSRENATNPLASNDLAALQATLDQKKKQLAEKQRYLQELNLHAPVDGVVIPHAYQPLKDDPEGPLPSWSGTLLMKRNIGAYVEPGPGAVVCEIGDDREMEAILYVDQSDVNFIRPGFEVDLVLESYPFETLRGKVQAVRNYAAEQVPTRMSGKGKGPIPTETTETGEVPLSACYEVQVLIDNSDGRLQSGMIGTAKIHAVRRTLAQRAWRFISETFAFKL